MANDSVCVVSVLSIVVDQKCRHLGIAGVYKNREIAFAAIKERSAIREHLQTYNQVGYLEGERVTLYNDEVYDLHTFEVWQRSDEGLGA